MKKSSSKKTPPEGGQTREMERLLTEISTKVDGLTHSMDGLTKQVERLNREMDRVTRMEEKQIADRSEITRLKADIDSIGGKHRECESRLSGFEMRLGKLEAEQDGDKRNIGLLWKILIPVVSAVIGGGGAVAALKGFFER